MLVVGLTGGIGCGKSAVSDIFNKEFSTPVIDADIIARNLTETSSVLNSIKQQLGEEFFNTQGELHRDKLRQAIFSNLVLRKKLENILHPLVFREIENNLSALNTNYCIVVIPLLLETGKKEIIDRILVVDCTVEQQIERVIQRDQCNEKHVKDIIATQIERSERLKLADDVIDNSHDIKFLHEKIAILHHKYTKESLIKNKK